MEKGVLEVSMSFMVRELIQHGESNIKRSGLLPATSFKLEERLVRAQAIIRKGS